MNSDYLNYLITAIDYDSAKAFASEQGLNDDEWFRLPTVLEDAPELFQQIATVPLSKEELSQLSKEKYAENSLVDSPGSRILFARSFDEASKYAAKRNWKIRAWREVVDDSLDSVIEYSFVNRK